MAIDVVEYLESVGVEIKYFGENVGPNDIAIQCPWCDDPSTHLTVHRTKGYLHCWRCEFDSYIANHPKGWTPSFKALIVEIEKCSWSRAKDIWEEIGGSSQEDSPSDPVKRDEGKRVCKLPEFCYSFDSPGSFRSIRDVAFKYLLGRNFNRYHVEKYNLMFTSLGYYQHRIIIPIYQGGVLVNWIGRRFNPNVKSRYFNSRYDNSVVRFSEMVCGVENWKGNVIRIVEGYFDKMRIGDSSLALNRSQFSRIQRNIISKLSGRKIPIHLILDPEAIQRSISIAEELSPFNPRIKIVQLEEGTDPASLSFDAIRYAEDSTKYYEF